MDQPVKHNVKLLEEIKYFSTGTLDETVSGRYLIMGAIIFHNFPISLFPDRVSSQRCWYKVIQVCK